MSKLPSDSTVISHWHHPIENFNTSALEFYTAVQQTLQTLQIPDLSISRIEWKEGGLLSARREYLRVSRGKVAFDICAAPFGTGFFFSSWLAELPLTHGPLYAAAVMFGIFVIYVFLINSTNVFAGIFLATVIVCIGGWLIGNAARRGNVGLEDSLRAMPFFGPLYERFFKPVTYYKIDTALMFQAAVHSKVLEVVDQLFVSRGVRAMTELERKPIMRAFYER